MDERVLQTQEWLNDTYGQLANFPVLTEDGITGYNTFRALIWALQHEVNIATPDGIFGNGTISALNQYYPTLQESSSPESETPENIIYILQGALWCKGLNPGGFTGVFGPNTANTIRSFQSMAGIAQDGIVRPYILQGIMNSDSYSFISTDDIYDTYRHQVQKGLNYYYGSQIGLIAPNGIWERKSQTNLIKAAQIEWGATVDGKWGDGTLSKAPTISRNTSGYTNSKRLLQWALTINGFYPGIADGVWGNATYNALYDFQDFLCLGADGICGKQTWASLLSTKGDKNRAATALDTSVQITEENAALLYQGGYRDIGRYLTNTPGSSFDKELYLYEIDILKEAGLNIFPIYQTSGGTASYFTAYQGIVDGYRAVRAAKWFGFPSTATIYFAVDYDVLMKEIDANIMPYFRSIKNIVNPYFNVGVYGPRLICSKLFENGLTSFSFVSDMSSGYTCNIGQKMPDNWSYDQFYEIPSSNSEFPGMGYDKVIASSRKTATTPSQFIAYETTNYPDTEMNVDIFRLLYNYAQEYLTERLLLAPSIKDINALVLRYLSSRNYNNWAWGIVLGSYDSGFDTYLASKFLIDDQNAIPTALLPENIYIYEDFTKRDIEVQHFAATLLALLSDNPAITKEVAAFAGWAGDFAQVGGVLYSTYDEFDLNNYFNLEDLKRVIGFMDTELINYTFKYEDDGEEVITSNSGFEFQDMIQDVDAFNLSCGFSFETSPIYDILEQYYVTLKSYKRRFQLFKANLINEFDKDTLKEVAEIFSKPDQITITALNAIFGTMFGSYDHDLYGDVMATAFSEKIEYYITGEVNVLL